MIALAVLAVVASVLGLDGEQAKLDKGLIDGLRPNDQARVYYTLTVESRPVRIEVGRAEIVKSDDFSSTARPLDSFPFRPGYSVEVELSPARVSPEALLEIAERRLGEREYEAARAYFEKMAEMLPDDPLVARKLSETQALLEDRDWREQERGRLGYYRLAARRSLEEGDLRSAQSFVRKILRVEPDDTAGLLLQGRLDLLERTDRMLRVPAGSVEIGVNLGEARFYNQQPRFSLKLGEYWIDRRPVSKTEFSNPGAESATPDRSGPAVVGISQVAASDYCRSLGKRLPTEFEWEAAALQSGFELADGVSEWTSSWYQPYPGNSNAEQEYGEKYRVVRGFSQQGEFDPRLRFFMPPDDRAQDVGFRCALDGKTPR